MFLQHDAKFVLNKFFMYINGRTIGDLLGYLTCHKWNGSSVVDYAAVSENLLDKICYFKGHQILCDISDHCCISFKLKTAAKINVGMSEENISQYPVKYKWHKNAITKFQEALTSAEVQDEISIFMNSVNNLTDEGINDTAVNLGRIYSLAAEKSLKVLSKSSNKKKTKKDKNKPWYDKSLIRLKRQVTDCGKSFSYAPIRGTIEEIILCTETVSEGL